MIEGGQLTLDVFIGKQAAWISQLIAQYGSTSCPSRCPRDRLVRSVARPRANAPARAARSGRAVAIPTAKALPVETGTSSVVPRARKSGRKGS